jgi:hypothetical protein
MSRQQEPYADPLIDEVRQRRRELYAGYGNDLRKLGEAIRQRQAQHPGLLVDHRQSSPPKK